MKRVVAGTTNPAKIDALRRLLAPVADIIEAPIPGKPTLDEDGRTIAEIASEKARAWSRWLGAHDIRLPVVVTDGGLTIPALAGRWDPTRTRRFAGAGLTPLQLAEALLERMSHLEGDDREIGWIEVAAIMRPDGRAALYSTMSPRGMLARSVRSEDLRGPDGFWVPAIWLCPEFGMKRLIDISEEEHARRPDHWDLLGAALREDLGSFLSDCGSRLAAT